LKGRELRAAILLLLDERHRVDPSLTVDDTEIVEALGAPIDDVRRHLDILEEQGLTKEANTLGGHSAYISPKGMAMAEELREDAEDEVPSQRPPIGFD
jgi:DNA-binding transcriptional ArsR family regulator